MVAGCKRVGWLPMREIPTERGESKHGGRVKMKGKERAGVMRIAGETNGGSGKVEAGVLLAAMSDQATGQPFATTG